jgi:putative membrane protein
MDFVIVSLGGLDEFLVYFALSLVFVAIFLALYVRITPYREFALIREGNAAAAASLSGSLIGFVFPLASAVTNAVNAWDMAIWAAVALAVQLLAYFVVRMLLPQLRQDIGKGRVASGVFLAAASISAGILNAACMTY